MLEWAFYHFCLKMTAKIALNSQINQAFGSLPCIDGVSPSTLTLPAQGCDFIFDYLVQVFGHIERNEWLERLRQKQIFFGHNGRFFVLDEKTPFMPYAKVYYYRFVKDEIPIAFDYELVFENARFMVIDKPHFLPTSPAGRYVKHTLLTRLKHASKNPDLSPIHRLDKDTAGLILFCKEAGYRGAYQSLFAKNAIKKTYHAIAPYDPNLSLPRVVNLHLCRGEPFYTMQVGCGLVNSQTHIELISHNGTWGLYELTPSTGKLHQLRVHLNHLGIPIKNDPFYPLVKHDTSFDKPLQLLAKSLSFVDPIDGKFYEFFSKKSLLLE